MNGSSTITEPPHMADDYVDDPRDEPETEEETELEPAAEGTPLVLGSSSQITLDLDDLRVTELVVKSATVPVEGSFDYQEEVQLLVTGRIVHSGRKEAKNGDVLHQEFKPMRVERFDG